jgi:aminoglycoside phosphotransferase
MKKLDLKIIKEILKKNKLQLGLKISKTPSGQINNSYVVDGRLVIKIQGEEEYTKGIFNHQKEITDKLIKKGAQVPEVIDFGEIEGKDYILMTKIQGCNLIYNWLEFKEKDQQKLIKEIADNLKIFHSFRFKNYNIPLFLNKSFENLEDSLKVRCDFNRITKDNLDEEILAELDFLKDYYQVNRKFIQEENTAVLVHNDIHFENIFVDRERKKIKGVIDFDWIAYAPIDYELKKIIDFIYHPTRYLKADLKKAYLNYDITQILKYLKKAYPELFSNPDLAIRIKLYFVENIINLIHKYQWRGYPMSFLETLKEKIKVIYKSDWIEQILDC